MLNSRPHRLAILALVFMAVLWGSTFVVTKDAMASLPLGDLLAIRYILAALTLALFMPTKLRIAPSVIGPGVILGLIFAAGQLTQTYGLVTTPASISGFLTGTYVILTPLFLGGFGRGRIAKRVWLAVGLALAGLGVFAAVPSAAATGLGWARH